MHVCLSVYMCVSVLVCVHVRETVGGVDWQSHLPQHYGAPYIINRWQKWTFCCILWGLKDHPAGFFYCRPVCVCPLYTMCRWRFTTNVRFLTCVFGSVPLWWMTWLSESCLQDGGCPFLLSRSMVTGLITEWQPSELTETPYIPSNIHHIKCQIQKGRCHRTDPWGSHK